MFLIGIGNQTKEVAFTLLGDEVIGYSLVPNNGGSSYYTILEGQSAPALIALIRNHLVAASTDGIHWNIPIDLPGQGNYGFGVWQNFQVINDVLFSISYTNQFVYSKDGVNFTFGTPSSNVFTGDPINILTEASTNQKVAVVVVSNSTEIAYTFDGINWSIRDTGNSIQSTQNYLFHDSVNNTGNFLVAYDVYSQNARVISLFEGQLQCSYQPPAALNLPFAPTSLTLSRNNSVLIHFLHDTAIFYDYNTGKIYNSSNGYFWEEVASVAPYSIADVNTYVDSNRIIIGGYNGTWMISTSGYHWAIFNDPSYGSYQYSTIQSVDYGSYYISSIATYDYTLNQWTYNGYVTSNFSTWHDLGDIYKVEFATFNGLVYRISSSEIQYTNNFVDWTSVKIFDSAIDVGNGSSIIINNVLIFNINGGFYSSADGINWVYTETPNYYGIYNYRLLDNKYVALLSSDYSAPISLISTDALNWQVSSVSLPQGSAYELVNFKYNNLREVQVSIGNQGSNGTAEVVGPVDVYTVPAGKRTLINSITITNTTGSQITYDLTIATSGTTPTQENSYYWDRAIPASHMDLISGPFTMAAGQSVVVFPSTVDAITVKVYGTELNA